MLNRVARKHRAQGRPAARAGGGDGGQPEELRRRQQEGDGERRLADAARAHSRRPARRHAARRDPLHRRGLEQERHGPAVPDLHPGQRLHARRVRDDGLRLAGGAGREGGPAGQGRRGADRRRRLRPEPGGARHRVRGRHRGDLGDHEQLRVRHHRRARAGALRHDLRHGVRKGRQALVARLRGHRPGLRRRRRQGGLGRRVQAGAGEGGQVEAPRRHRRRT